MMALLLDERRHENQPINASQGVNQVGCQPKEDHSRNEGQMKRDEGLPRSDGGLSGE
jgi:hypothetical protein